MKAINTQNKINLASNSKGNCSKAIVLATMLATVMVSTSASAYNSTLDKN